jgi:hypothetical protein
MTAYITAIIFLVITPGPGVLTTAGVGSAYGFQAGLAYMFGIIFGSLIAMSAVGSGLAAIVFWFLIFRIHLYSHPFRIYCTRPFASRRLEHASPLLRQTSHLAS